MKIKKGDKVMVIAGKARGTSGTVARAFPAQDKVIVEGVNVVKRHRKPTLRNRTGSVVEKALPIHVSNVMLIDSSTGKPTRKRLN